MKLHILNIFVGFVEKNSLTKPVSFYRIRLNTLNIKTFEIKNKFRSVLMRINLG